MRNWPLRRMLAAVFVALGVVTLVIVILTTAAFAALNDARNDRVDKYGPAVLASETLAKAFSDQETGLRGFVSAGDVAFLEPYDEGRASERDQERLLRGLLEGRPDLQQRLDAVNSAARTWQRSVAEPAIATTRSRGPRATTTDDIEAGKQRFDEVRDAITQLQDPLLVSRDASTRSLDRNLALLRIVLLVSFLLLIVLAAATWLALRRWVTDPLSRFGGEVDRVEGGDLAHAVVLESAPAEIRMLADQVDRMRIRIVQEYALAEQAREDALQARAQVEEQALDLQRSNTELEQFAYVASHDLQEPLRKVASFCQLLERRYKGQLDERGEQYIDFAVDGAKRMQRLINDLLAFSRVGRLTTEFVDVDLDEALAQALRQLALSIEESGAAITHDPLPTIRGDGTLLVQLFQNLVGNAVKFRGDDPPAAHIGIRRDGDMWELWCSDNGIGIEAQYADKIFVIFQRLHGRDVYGGTGIGLAMCKKIVEYHGGRMWLDEDATADSTSGATFRWTLPVATVDGATDPGENDERTTRHGAVTADAADRGAVGGGRPR